MIGLNMFCPGCGKYGGIVHECDPLDVAEFLQRKGIETIVIKPTVGRVVWYYGPTADGSRRDYPLAAHVCFVHSDSMVNLMVIDENGQPQAWTSVILIQQGDKVPQDRYCCWMPYQQGQQKKTEEAEKKLAEATA